MENKIDIKKEWKTPSLKKLEVVKTLGIVEWLVGS